VETGGYMWWSFSRFVIIETFVQEHGHTLSFIALQLKFN